MTPLQVTRNVYEIFVIETLDNPVFFGYILENVFQSL
jgi:hypothetical protein